jgi:hypothetical protein
MPVFGSIGRKSATGHSGTPGMAYQTHLRTSPTEGRASAVTIPTNRARSAIISN